MKNDEKKFRHESLQDRETIADLLSSLQQGLSQGVLKFSDEDNAITMKPSGLLNLAIKASNNAELNVLDVRISWQASGSKKTKKAIKLSTK